MGRNDCEQTRDLLPLLIRGQLLEAGAAAAEAHLATCADCRDEAGMVRRLAEHVLVAPPALEARVLLAIRRPVRRRGWSPARVAMAAAVAAAVLSGSVILERWAQQSAPEPSGTLVLEDGVPPAVSWGVAHDALLQSGSSLTQLSVEELELILQELDS